MNEDRVKKYIHIWYQNIYKNNIQELELDIGISLEDLVLEMFRNLYLQYGDEILCIPVNDDKYSDYIIKPKDGFYTLEDFLLNRLMRNVLCIEYSDRYNTSCYDHEGNMIIIDENRIRRDTSDIRAKKKIVVHEILHGMKTQFFDSDFFCCAIEYNKMKEEAKRRFGNEINDFEEKKDGIYTGYKHIGIEYNYRIKDCKLDLLDEITNESDSIKCSNDDFVGTFKLGDFNLVLKNPESSNTYVTNYSYIFSKLLTTKVLFDGLYLEPQKLYNEFELLYGNVFRKRYRIDKSAIEILEEQLELIKRSPDNIDLHKRLLNTLYECIYRKYEDKDERDNAIGVLGYNGLFDFKDHTIKIPEGLDYASEYLALVAKRKSRKI